METLNKLLSMKTKSLLLLLLLTLSNSMFSQTYITNVTIADVEKQRWIPNQTVIIKDDRIVNIQKSSKIKIPESAIVINGTDKYVLPGLTDAHIHFSQSGGLYTRPDVINLQKDMPYQKEIDYSHETMEELLHRYLQNGITNVIDVGTTINFLKQRELFKNNDDVPSIYMT